jgi:hypothetical protein
VEARLSLRDLLQVLARLSSETGDVDDERRHK